MNPFRLVGRGLWKKLTNLGFSRLPVGQEPLSRVDV